MGRVIHHAIVVTSWDESRLALVADKATQLGLVIAGPSAEVINGYRTLVVCPDGSKSGWLEDQHGNTARSELKAYIDTLGYEDGSSNLEWVEVMYGNDLRENDARAAVTDDQHGRKS